MVLVKTIVLSQRIFRLKSQLLHSILCDVGQITKLNSQKPCCPHLLHSSNHIYFNECIEDSV